METIGKVLTSDELSDLVKANDYELFDEIQVASFTADNIEDENTQLIVKSLKRVEVMLPNYKKTAFYVRERQVDWIEKGYGVYRDTELNRRLDIEGSEIILDTFEKGKGAAVGEIREWSGKKYQKRSDGKWRPVRKEGKGNSKEMDSKDTAKDDKKLARYDKFFQMAEKVYDEVPYDKLENRKLIQSALKKHGYPTDPLTVGEVLRLIQRETKEKLTPKNAYDKMTRDEMKALSEIKLERKPGDFSDIRGQDFEKFSQSTKNALNKLPIVDLPDGYGSSDKGNKSFWSNLPETLQGGFFIGKASDGNYYHIDTQGYDYARYVQRLDNFKPSSKP